MQMNKTTINIIGCGKVGKALAKAIHLQQLGEIKGVYNRDAEKSQQSVKFIGHGIAIHDLECLPMADVYLITTGDPYIQPTLQKMLALDVIQENSLLIHTSGIETSQALRDGRNKACQIASAHPVHSFAQPERAYQQWSGCPIAVEGDTTATAWLFNLFQAMNAKPFPIHTEHKPLYHAACVMASNNLIALFDASQSLFAAAGIDNEQSKALTTQLIRSSLDNIENTQALSQALTGPVQRRDVATITQHLTHIQDNKLRALYCQLGLRLLELNPQASQVDSAIRQLLEQ